MGGARVGRGSSSGALRETGAAPGPRLPTNWSLSPGTEGSRAETGMCGAEAGLVCCLGGTDTPQVSFGVPLGSDCLAQGQGLGVVWASNLAGARGPGTPFSAAGRGWVFPPLHTSFSPLVRSPCPHPSDVHTARRPLCSLPRHSWSPRSGWGASHGGEGARMVGAAGAGGDGV